MKSILDEDDSILEMIYFNEKFKASNKKFHNHDSMFRSGNDYQKNDDSNLKIIILSNKKSSNCYKKSTYAYLDKDIISSNRILNNFLSKSSLSNHNQHYELIIDANKFFIKLTSVKDCIEYLKDSSFNININNQNLISYLNAFTIFGLEKLIESTLDKLMNNLSNINTILFIKYISTITEQNFIIKNCNIFKIGKYKIEELHKLVFWLINNLVTKKFNITLINNDNDGIVDEIENKNCFSLKMINKIYYDKKFLSNISFKKNDKLIFCENQDLKDSIELDLQFLSYIKHEMLKKSSIYHIENNYFNTGKVHRRKSKEGLTNDYPHYFQMILDNDPNLQLFAVRISENSNFILSKNANNFNKFSEDYVGEVEANFWGTQFEIYDNGVDKKLIDNVPNCIFSERKLIGKIIYDTNIMGECPRYFKSELYTSSSDNIQTTHYIKNLDPDWNVKLNCYCLNFYGRVKKASARNFQMVFSDDQEDILLQHGKENSNEFNIDFREPFNYVTSFAHSLVSIGRKRIVS
jgi:hypothetical protein